MTHEKRARRDHGLTNMSDEAEKIARERAEKAERELAYLDEIVHQ